MHDRSAVSAAGRQDACCLAHGAVQVVRVHQRHERDDEIGGAVLQRERRGVSLTDVQAGVGLAGVPDHRRRAIDGHNGVSELLQVA
jgi:hypothetical protein